MRERNSCEILFCIWGIFYTDRGQILDIPFVKLCEI